VAENGRFVLVAAVLTRFPRPRRRYRLFVEVHAAFRRGNEAIAEAARGLGLGDVKIDFICECVDSECFGRVRLTLNDYERIRRDGGSVTLADHAVSG
jgi:hypothetical protein